MYPKLALLIDGEWLEEAGRQSQPVHNPATGEFLGALPLATPQDIDRAIDAADKAFLAWRRVTALERGRILMRVADALRARAQGLARILTLEQGKTLAEAAGEIIGCADTFEWMAEEGKRVYGRIVPSRFAGSEQLVTQEPIGPVGAFSPWNFPAVLACRKIATALAAGCTIVIKPAEETPGILVAIARICQEAGVPDGVLNVVYGVPDDISRRLIASPKIKKLSFTGSVPVGRHLAALAGAAMKKITLELGGHSPVIVMDDTDIERVATMAVAAKFRNAGQLCHCPTRFFVHERVHSRFVEAFATRARALRVGDGLRPDTQMGPLINARRLTAMRELTEDAAGKGARVLCGGESPSDAGNGFFWMPTVLDNLPDNARALSEEPFGPLALMIPFATLEDAIGMANTVEYGLASYAFTNSMQAAQRIQETIEAGCLSLNTFSMSPPELPFSGVKQSGQGAEMGSEGLLEHFRVKAVIRATL